MDLIRWGCEIFSLKLDYHMGKEGAGERLKAQIDSLVQGQGNEVEAAFRALVADEDLAWRAQDPDEDALYGLVELIGAWIVFHGRLPFDIHPDLGSNATKLLFHCLQYVFQFDLPSSKATADWLRFYMPNVPTMDDDTFMSFADAYRVSSSASDIPEMETISESFRARPQINKVDEEAFNRRLADLR